MIHHFIDHVDLGDDGLPPGFLHQGPDVAYSQTNQEVHDDNGEQEDIGSKEQMGSAYELNKIQGKLKNYFYNDLLASIPLDIIHWCSRF